VGRETEQACSSRGRGWPRGEALVGSGGLEDREEVSVCAISILFVCSCDS